MKRSVFLVSAFSALLCAGGVKYVDEFDLSAATAGAGKKVAARQSVDGHPITLSGKVYARGIGTHPEGCVAFAANGKVTAFEALVGIDDDAKKAGSGKSYGKPTAEFRVWADGKVVWRSGERKLGQDPVSVNVPLAGAREILLETIGGGVWTAFDAANCGWGDARFTCEDGAELRPITDPALTAQLGILTPPEKPEPQINGADIWGVRPGHPVIFRIATSGVRPMTFTAKGLPPGVTLDPAKGILGGVAPKEKGAYDITVTASNAKGSATRVIRLAVGDTIALTPPMGWNSWNVWCYRLTDEYARSSAKAMDASGLGDHGWAYINLDDWWEMNNSGCPRIKERQEYFNREDVIGPARDAEGRIIPNRSFPDMKALTDYIHSFGFKAGLYSSPGPVTCGRCEGSYQHEMQDATSWAEWGFDYVKYDWCSYGKVFNEELKAAGQKHPAREGVRHPGYEKPYRLMGECLKKQNRDILYSFCQYGMGKTEEWARDAGANCWRSWDDLKDAWVWMEKAIESRIGAEYWKWSAPGCWADPDMMIIGGQHSFGSDHPTFLTPNEQYTHVSLWCMIGSPLLIGCDLAALDEFTRNLLVNDEVIAVSQDRLGMAARRIRHTDAESVWTRPLVDGSLAVALVNRYPLAREIKVPFLDLGLGGGQYVVRDLWRQRCEGKHSGFYAVKVPPHGTHLVRIRPVSCSKCD